MNRCKNLNVIVGRNSCSCYRKIFKQNEMGDIPEHFCNKSENELYLDNLCFDLSNEEILEELLEEVPEYENVKCGIDSEWAIERTFNAIKELECISYLENSSFNGFKYFNNNYELAERKQELYNEIKNMTTELKDRI